MSPVNERLSSRRVCVQFRLGSSSEQVPRSQLPHPVLVGIEAIGSMHWFLNLMEELGIECRVGHPATIRAAAPRKQKDDRLDADLILKLLAENGFPAIWLPTNELFDLQATVAKYMVRQRKPQEPPRCGLITAEDPHRRMTEKCRQIGQLIGAEIESEHRKTQA